jgi:hypothetical protein
MPNNNIPTERTQVPINAVTGEVEFLVSDYATNRDLTISASSDDAPHRKDGFRAGQTPVTCATDRQ